MISIYEKIIEAMEDRNINKRELAEKTGINFNTLRGYIDSANNIPLENLSKIAKALSVSVAYLIGEVPFKNFDAEVIKFLDYFYNVLNVSKN